MNIQFFASQLKNGGARPTLFEVQGSIGAEGQVPQTPFLVEAASLPASSLGVITVPYRGRQIKMPGDRRYADWSIQIINDGEFKLRNSFEAWVNTIQSAQGNKSDANNHTPYNTPIYCDWQVNQLDRTGAPIKSYLFVGCFPVEVGAIELSSGASDEIERFAVTMAYSYFVTKEAQKNTKRVTTDGQGLVDVKVLTGGG